MSFEFQKPQLHQNQNLNISYLMKKTFSILQMTNLELKEFVLSEIEKNPILNIKEKSSPIILKNEKKRIYSLKYKPSLFEHLFLQAKEIFQTKEDIFIAENIIGNLDEKGYFTYDINTLANELKIQSYKIYKILKIIKTFDPKGIAAQNLKERILLQINKKNSLTYKIIKDYFDEILNNKISVIAKKLKITYKEAQIQIEKILKNTNFDPTSNFSSTLNSNIFADIIIKKINKNWIITIEEDLPHFIINNSYVKILENEKKGSSKKYIFGAKVLMKNILIRRKTLLKIVFYIVKKQNRFLLGKSNLNFLTIKELANFLNVHPSTISRALLNKYIQCPLGLFSIKSFFSNSYNKKTNLFLIDSALKEIISYENPLEPLSDIELTKKLQKKGFNLQRRTISKHRKKLFIGNAYQRKKYI